MFSRPARCLVLILTAQAGLIAWSATRHSPGYDEVGHLGAALAHWELGTFDAYKVNPPLVRFVAAMPLLTAGVTGPVPGVMNCDPPCRPEFKIGEEFIAAHGERSFWWFAVARWACLPFALLGTVVCFLWARDLYGAWSGVAAATLWCICPNVLGHAPMITPDVPAAATGAAACYLFWRWLRGPTGGRAIAAGTALGVALLCKFTLVILFGVWPLTWALWRLTARRAGGPTAGRQAAQLGLAFAVTLGVINIGFGFEDSGRPLGAYRFFSGALTGEPLPAERELRAAPQPGNRFAGTWVAGVPVPLPTNYLSGIDVQRVEFEAGYRSYLRGEWRDGGWWYYYLYGLVVKSPLGTLGMLALAGAAAARVGRRDELVLLAPAAVVLALVSSQTGFNHHLRYVLPAVPFVFIWAGRAVATRSAFVRRAAWVALACAAVESLAAYPHSLAFFNAAAGGPANGPAHLLDSNIDWGQDLLHLRHWADAHPDARPLRLAFYGRVDPRVAGFADGMPPPLPSDRAGLNPDLVGPRPGWYAVSVNLLHGHRGIVHAGDGNRVVLDDGWFEYFRRFPPTGRAGFSIHVYHLGRDECNRVREELGLPALD